MLNRLFFAFALFFCIDMGAFAQHKDSLSLFNDTIKLTDSAKVIDSSFKSNSYFINDSSQPVVDRSATADPGLKRILDSNIYLNSKGKPVTFIQSPRKNESKDVVFYALAALVLLFAVLRFLYPRYFSNLFRVFFNTSLRQNQLTDQLLQAKLPSLLYNIFFILVGGWYLYLLLNHYGKAGFFSKWEILLICAASLLIIYVVKFSILKFTGWITGFKQEADIYIFIIFLINKIIGICLIPFIIIIAFSDKALVDVAIMVSFIIIILMTLMRFFRAYSLLQNRLKISRFHFIIYILGVEIIPLFAIYKLALIFMSNNL